MGTIDPAVDATGQPYTYAGDNPVNAIDPTGLSWYNPSSWSAKTWGTVLGIAAVALGGVGLAFSTELASHIGLAAAFFGTVAEADACSQHDTEACVSMVLGIVAVAVGGASADILFSGATSVGGRATAEAIVAAANWRSVRAALDAMGLNITGGAVSMDVTMWLAEAKC